jgi:nickel/cobalt exporter
MPINGKTESICPGHFRLRLWLFMVAAALWLFPTRLPAHPMGNFSVNHYTQITIEGGTVELRYVIDMAEIPTFQEMQQGAIAANPADAKVTAFLAAQAKALMEGLQLTVNGHPLLLLVASQDVIFPSGAGNLPTMKLGLIYRAAITDACDTERCDLSYRDLNFPGRAGWKEIVARAAPGIALISSTVPSRDRSALLTNYPTDLLNSPPQDVEARIVFSRGTEPAQALSRDVKRSHGKDKPKQKASSPATSLGVNRPPSASGLQLEANRQATPRNAFTELMRAQRLSIGLILLAAVISAGLGALHALEPGHGKTIVAAYLVGSKGTAQHAVALGMIVTISHTAGVYLLGAITLYAQKYILPEKLYPFLGVLSGIFIAGMGFYLFLQRYIGSEFAGLHSHGPGGHHHGRLLSSRANSEPDQETGRIVSARQLMVLGITGGIVPCPAALVVLLSAVALHRVGFGFFLILAFSLGLAAVLIAMGLLVVYAGRMMSRLPVESPVIQRWLPLTSAVMITVLGCSIAVRGLMVAGVLHIRL